MRELEHFYVTAVKGPDRKLELDGETFTVDRSRAASWTEFPRRQILKGVFYRSGGYGFIRPLCDDEVEALKAERYASTRPKQLKLHPLKGESK